MRVVFAGTSGFSIASLMALLDADDIDVVGVVSQPDRKSGRGMKQAPSAVKQAALHADIDVITPHTLRDNSEALSWLQNRQADMLVVVAFGMLLPKTWLNAINIAAVNVHASLLPRWRGAAPIERSLLAGDSQTGVCIMQMEEGLDTGGVYARRTLAITDQTTGSELWLALAPMGSALLIETLPKIAAGLNPEPQDEQDITYAHKIHNEERIIDWHKSASEIDRLVRCFTPRPGVRTRCNGKWLKLIAGIALSATHHAETGALLDTEYGLDIACAGGSVYRITKLQPEGKKAMQATDFLRGAQLSAATVLGEG